MSSKGRNSAVYSAFKLIKQDSLTGSPIVGGTCRGLLVGTAGTATFIDGDGNTCTNAPLQAGYNPVQIQQITSLGTASDVWAYW
jgi:hypothetical protein